MALLHHGGSFVTGTGAIGTTVAVTGVGFTPIAIMFWAAGRNVTSPPTLATSHQRGVGFATGIASRRCYGSFSSGSVATAVCTSGRRNDACVMTMTTGGSVDGLMDLQSLDVDGFTMVIDDAFSASIRVYYQAWGGDVDAASIIDISEPGATGSVSYTGVGFTPSAIIGFQPNGAATTWNGTSNDTSCALGWATGPSNQGVWAGAANNGSNPSVTMSYCRAGQFLAATNASASAITATATLTSMDSDGFTLNWTTVGTAGRIYAVLALHGGTWLATNGTTQTDTVTTIPLTGLGATCKSVMVLSHHRAQSASLTPDSNDEWSLGEAPDANGTSMMDVTAVSNTKVESRCNTQVYANFDTSLAVEGLMTTNSFDGDGVTFIMTDADPSAAFFLALMAGDTISAPMTGGGAFYYYHHRRMGG